MIRWPREALFVLVSICACSATPPADPYNPSGLGGSSSNGANGGNSALGGSAGSHIGSGGSAGNPAGGSTGLGGAGGTLSSMGGQGGAGGVGGVGGMPYMGRQPKSPTASLVYVDGLRLMVGKRASNGMLAAPTPYAIKGVGWSPTGIGESNNGGGYTKLYTEHAPTDVPLMSTQLHANTVKTYDDFEQNAQGLAVLDQLYASGVMVLMTVMIGHTTTQDQYVAAVNYFKNHPGILGWVIGNEFNYNNLYGAANYDQAVGMVNTAVTAIHAADPDHPVLVGYGEVPSPSNYAAIPGPDIWAINLYPNLDLNSRITAWTKVSKKPMIVGEYGADAFNSKTNSEDQASQATATNTLTNQIILHYSSNGMDAAHCVIGGTIYALTDEWWKDPNGNANTHDNGGFANTIYPDGQANEEWWGLATIQRQPRQAFTTLANLYANN